MTNRRPKALPLESTTVPATDGNAIPNGWHSAAEILRLARELDVPGKLIRRGRATETRAYAVRLESGSILMWRINAPAAEHYTGR